MTISEKLRSQIVSELMNDVSVNLEKNGHIANETSLFQQANHHFDQLIVGINKLLAKNYPSEVISPLMMKILSQQGLSEKSAEDLISALRDN